MEINPREQTVAFLRRAQKILLVVPQEMSGDSLCALLAWNEILGRMGKEKVSIVPQEIPKHFHFLGGAKSVRRGLDEEGDFVISLSTAKAKVERVKYTIKDDSVDILISPKSGFFSPSDVTFQQSAGKFDLILTLGADSLESLGELFEAHPQLFATTPVINISASPANQFFGKVNLVDPSKSSVCEILFELLEKNDFLLEHMDSRLATILLTGILAETETFLSSSTTAGALEAAARLQTMGAHQSEIIEHLFKMKSLATLKLWGRILGNLEMDPVHRITWSNVVKADFELAEAVPEDTDVIADQLLRYTKGVELAVLFLEGKKKTVIQIRSAIPAIQFSDLQNHLGGGGALVQGGMDFEIPKKGVAEVQFEVLRLLVQFQKKRLHIPEEIEIQKTDLSETVSPAQTSLPIETQAPAVSPTPPSEIPFDAPHKPHENAAFESVPPGTRTVEVTVAPDNSSIPDWLRKNFSK